MVGRFLTPCLRIWLFSGLDLAPWQKVNLAILVQLNRLHIAYGWFNAHLYRMGLADDKNCACENIQYTRHIFNKFTVLAPPCSITNTTDENLIKYLCNSFF